MDITLVLVLRKTTVLLVASLVRTNRGSLVFRVQVVPTAFPTTRLHVTRVLLASIRLPYAPTKPTQCAPTAYLAVLFRALSMRTHAPRAPTALLVSIRLQRARRVQIRPASHALPDSHVRTPRPKSPVPPTAFV